MYVSVKDSVCMDLVRAIVMSIHKCVHLEESEVFLYFIFLLFVFLNEKLL